MTAASATTSSMPLARCATQQVTLARLGADGTETQASRVLAVEAPVAIEVDGLGYAVMMATPAALDDFAWGFAWSERLIDRSDEIVAVDAHRAAQGILLRLTLAPHLHERVLGRIRHRTSDSACGLCGIESLDQALRPLPSLPCRPPAEAVSVFRALAALAAHQPLNRATGAAHAAARCSADGAIVAVREDVGRHNAFDKLVGAMLRAGEGWEDGFALLTSRCSYEIVEKAVLAGCPTLVTISAPTSLAVERARDAGLRLIVLARPDAMLRLSSDAD